MKHIKLFEHFINEGVHEQRDGFYSPSDIKKLRKFAEQISDEIIDTYEDDKNIDADDYTPEEMFNYISAWGADNQMKAANLIKEFNWELLTQELGLE